MSNEIHIGFTGTQNGLKPAQFEKLWNVLVLYGYKTILHHGDCIGADSQAHDIAESLGMRIVIHPPTSGTKRAWRQSPFIEEPKPYMDRNQAIVDASPDIFIACPNEMDEQVRSGTWSTVRKARKAQDNVYLGMKIYTIYPNGEMDERVNP